jgi:hypothetical protein
MFLFVVSFLSLGYFALCCLEESIIMRVVIWVKCLFGNNDGDFPPGV